MQDYLNEEDEDETPYNSDEKVSDVVNDFSDDDESSDDDFDSDSGEEFEETTVEETPAETDSQTDHVEEPAETSREEFPEADAPVGESPAEDKPSFRVMSFEDFITSK